MLADQKVSVCSYEHPAVPAGRILVKQGVLIRKLRLNQQLPVVLRMMRVSPRSCGTEYGQNMSKPTWRIHVHGQILMAKSY